MNPQNNSLIKILAVFTILAIGVLGSFVISNVAFNYWTQGIDEEGRLGLKLYEDHASELTDVNFLTNSGLKQLHYGNNQFALISLKRATELEPRSRDAWLWLGYAQYKNNDATSALSSLKKAEALDPVNAKTYEILALVYSQLNDPTAAKAARDRYVILSR